MTRSTLHRKRLSGSVLIIVLIVCLALVSLTLVLSHTMMMAYRGSDNDLAGRQAEMAVEGAAQYAEVILSSTDQQGAMPDPTTYESQAVPMGDATFWFIGEPQPTDTSNQVTFGLVDESSKLNLNTATATMLENLPGVTEDLANAIVAWRTSGTASVSSTTSSASSSTTPVKAAPFESVEELAQVDGGIDLLTLYGTDNNLNHVLDPDESAAGVSTFAPGLLEYVTVFSREPNVLATGSNRVDVSQTGGPLTQLLGATLGTARGAQIEAAARGGAPIRSVLEFYERSGMTPAEFGEVSPMLTATSGPYSYGLVNVNSASATVLECIPGITQSIAQQIITARASQAETTGTSIPNLAWVQQYIPLSIATQAGPYLTAETFQVSADVAAVGRHGRGYHRTQFVIDTSGTGGTPQIVYRRDLSGLGWAVGSAERQSLAKEEDMQ